MSCSDLFDKINFIGNDVPTGSFTEFDNREVI